MADEARRLRKLEDSGILENINYNDPDFDRLSHLACRLFGVKVVLINFVGNDSNIITSKAGSSCNTIFGKSYSRQGSICHYTVKVKIDTTSKSQLDHFPLNHFTVPQSGCFHRS